MAKPLRFLENIVDSFKKKETNEFDVEFDSRISKIHGILDEQRFEEKSKNISVDSSRVKFLEKPIAKKNILKKNVDFVSKKQFNLAIKKLSADFEKKVNDSNVLITKNHQVQNKLNIKEKKIAENIDNLVLLMEKVNVDDLHNRLNSVEKFTKEIKRGVKSNKQNVAHIDSDILNKFDVLISDLETRHNKSNKDIKKIEKKLIDFKSDMSNKNIDARMRVIESSIKKFDKKVENKLDKINDLLDVTRKSIVVDKKTETLLNKKITVVTSDSDSLKSDLQTLSEKLDAVSMDSGVENVDERLNAIEMLTNSFDKKIETKLSNKIKIVDDKIRFFETESNKQIKKIESNVLSSEKKLVGTIDSFNVENKKSVTKNSTELKKAIGVIISRLDNVIDKENNLFLMTRAELEDTRKIESAYGLKQNDLVEKISSFSMSSLSETNNLNDYIKKLGTLESKLDLKVSGLGDEIRNTFNSENRLSDFNDLEKHKPVVVAKNIGFVAEKNYVVDKSEDDLNKIDLDLKLVTRLSMLLLEIDNLLDENSETISDDLNQKKHELSKLAELISDSDSSLINSLSLSLYLITLDIDKMDIVKTRDEIVKSRALLGCNDNK